MPAAETSTKVNNPTSNGASAQSRRSVFLSNICQLDIFSPIQVERQLGHHPKVISNLCHTQMFAAKEVEGVLRRRWSTRKNLSTKTTTRQGCWAHHRPAGMNSCTHRISRCCAWAAAWWCRKKSAFSGWRSIREVLYEVPSVAQTRSRQKLFQGPQ